jgi:ribonuclease HII
MVIYDSSMYESDPPEILRSVTDSKQLTHKKRLAALDVIRSHALAYTRIFIPHTVIDECGINRATEIAISKMIKNISIKPQAILMDGSFRFTFDIPFHSAVRGDCRSISIASASVIAKVDRDSVMCRLDSRFPGYGFAGHKGYGTKTHMASLRSMGLCPVHRRSYEPARSMLESQGILFDEDNRLR